MNSKQEILSSVAQSAYRIRRYSVRMGEVQGQGYVGQALGYADVLAVAYCHAMNFRPNEPKWEGRDRFLLSHGHYAIAHYAAMIEVGIIPESELDTYGSDDSRLPMSGMATYTPGMEISGGSLGQGLSVAIGAAQAKKLNKDTNLVYVLTGDGELQEGQNWEAIMYASAKNVDNLIATVDLNGQQIDGSTTDVLNMGNVKAKFEAFDWDVLEITEGNNIEAIINVMADAKSRTGKGKPVCVLLHTEMGNGVDFMMHTHAWHGKAPSNEQLENALNQNPATLGDY